MIREVAGGNGYSSQSTTRLHFGLGAVSKLDSLEIRWPSGLVQKVEVPINRITYVKEGSGVIKPPLAVAKIEALNRR
jgi:hypothetical protein